MVSATLGAVTNGKTRNILTRTVFIVRFCLARTTDLVLTRLQVSYETLAKMQSDNEGDQVQFNVSNLQSGYYFIQIDNGTTQITEKFIVFK